MIKLPESSSDYPALWKSNCSKLRIIRCKDDIQYIVQAWQAPKWRHLSYHVDWNSIELRWHGLDIPDAAPKSNLTSTPQLEHGILSEVMGL